MEKHKSRACNLAKKCKKKEDDYFLVTLSDLSDEFRGGSFRSIAS